MKLNSNQISEQLGSVLNDLRSGDAVTHVIMHEDILLKYGQTLIDMQLEEELYRKKAYIRNCLRNAGQFLIDLRAETGRTNASFEAFLLPAHFDLICKVAKSCTESAERTLKIGFLLGHLCNILIGKYRRLDDATRVETIQNLRNMYETEWKIQVSCRVLKQKKRKKMNQKVR